MQIWLLLINILVLVLGVVAGSVANAVIYRLPKGISWTKGKSICTTCKHKLAGKDLVPVVSYLLLGGKCRYCNKPIGFRYLAVELVMGGGFLLIFNFQFSIFNEFSIINLLLLLAICWVTVVIAVMDWETKLVSELMVGLWGTLAIIFNIQYSIFNQSQISNLQFQLEQSVLGVVVGLVLIGGVWLVTKGKGMGFGDVEIAVVMGLWLGWPKIGVGLWLAFVTGALGGLMLLTMRKSKLKSEIAFGTFLVFGAWIAFLFGENISSLILLGW